VLVKTRLMGRERDGHYKGLHPKESTQIPNEEERDNVKRKPPTRQLKRKKGGGNLKGKVGCKKEGDSPSSLQCVEEDQRLTAQRKRGTRNLLFKKEKKNSIQARL